jgi:hypothetical protein
MFIGLVSERYQTRVQIGSSTASDMLADTVSNWLQAGFRVVSARVSTWFQLGFKVVSDGF